MLERRKLARVSEPAPPEVAPPEIAPMLARTGELPLGDGWAYELKWDGVRAIARCNAGAVALASRNGRDVTRSYPELLGLADAVGRPAVLDGEIVALDERGVPSFSRLQQRMHVESGPAAAQRAAATPAIYMIFDLLWLDGESLLALPYRERRAGLLALGLAAAAWQTPAAHQGDAAELLAATAATGLEGLVAKRSDSTYEPGRRTGAWVKVKHVRRQELVIGGWLPGAGRRTNSLGALLLGHHAPGGELVYAGRVGTGFSDAMLAHLQARLTELARPDSPFAPVQLPPEARFVSPTLVAQVGFSQWTPDGVLRHPTFLGLRDDVDPRAVVREDQPAVLAGAGRGRRASPRAAGAARAAAERDQHATAGASRPSPSDVRLSNLDKVLFPASGFTKGELIDYYGAIAAVMVEHLCGRALTLKRYPDGVDAKFFYEKRCPGHRPDWVRTVRVASGRAAEGAIDHCVACDAATLVWMANLAAVELHVPMARAQAPDAPTAVVFDLDPGAPAGLQECLEVGLILEGMFSSLGLESVVKTSGSKGLQVYLPVDGSATHTQTKSFARQVAMLLAGQLPDLVLANMNRTARAGRVFVDWSQNDRHKTTVAVYSVRATEQPSVSAPLRWDEVRAARDGAAADGLRHSPAQVLERVRAHGDLFAPALSMSQRLPSP